MTRNKMQLDSFVWLKGPYNAATLLHSPKRTPTPQRTLHGSRCHQAPMLGLQFSSKVQQWSLERTSSLTTCKPRKEWKKHNVLVLQPRILLNSSCLGKAAAWVDVTHLRAKKTKRKLLHNHRETRKAAATGAQFREPQPAKCDFCIVFWVIAAAVTPSHWSTLTQIYPPL